MIISFSSAKQEQLANNTAKLEKYVLKTKANCTADEVLATLDVLAAADSLYDVPSRPYHPHPLKGALKGQFAVWIGKRDRIKFYPDHKGDPEYRIDNYKTIKRIVVVNLCTDYHDR